MVATGFFGAPTTKLWMVALGGASVLFSTMNWKPYLRLRLVPHISRDKQVWRLATSLLAFPNSTEVLTSLMLMYQLRIVERLFGTRKFASFLFVMAVVGQSLELLLLLATSGSPSKRFNIAAAGPYSLIFATLYQFYALVPVKYKIRLFGVEVGDKWTAYTLAFHLLVLRLPGTLVPALAGIFASMIYSADVAGLKQWRFPLWANRLAGRWVLPLLSPSNAPTGPRSRETIPGISTGLNGAGFAQMVARNAGLQVNGNGNGAAQRRRANGRNTPNQGQQQQQQQQQGVRRADTSTSLGSYLSELGPEDLAEVTDEQILLLQDMFPQASRDQVIQALQLSNNDPNRAVSVLLSNSS